ncbi:hypothetical protein BG000_003770 [Podila horticola]|nr:hypothetical protein BG000_003770 [Podila horticola]
MTRGLLAHTHVRSHFRRYAAVATDTDHRSTVAEADTLSSVAHKRKERVLLLMSGGVDSSICAHILHNQGYDVTGLYMHNWNHQEETQDEMPQQSGSTISTAHLHESVDTSSTTPSENRTPRTAPIRPKVFEVMLQEYEQGRTPNPDVTCNREIKFGELIIWCEQNGGLGKDRYSREETLQDLDSIRGQGWDYLATGHYARVERDPVTGKAKLLRAVDSNKDQTYYLSTLSEKVLRHVLFPLAQFDKPTVKQMAMKAGESQLKSVASKKESMGICFVGQRRRFGDFLREYLDARPGPVRVLGLDGPLIGEHKGLFQYTVGQASAIIHGYQKWVVLRTDLPSNTLIVVEGTQNKRLFSRGLTAHKWHWISGEPPKKLLESGSNPGGVDEYPFTAQIRHRQTPQPCAIEPVLDVMSPSTTFRVRFKDLQRAIAPGQQIVLYDQDECLGGAEIQAGLPLPIEDE